MTPHTMRTPCKSGCGVDGYIETKNGQDCVYCAKCNRYAGYNAPKSETGRAPRSLTTGRLSIKPARRARLFDRDNCRCVLCGGRERLDIGHLLSVADGLRMGLSEEEINHDENLAVMCAECNSGMSDRPVSLRLLMLILKARIQLQT